MIGNGIAALASTTALAPTGGNGRTSARPEDGDFADTLGRMLRKETVGPDEVRPEAGETPSTKPETDRAHHRDLFARTGWRNAGETAAAAISRETNGEETATQEAGSDGKTGKASLRVEEPAAETVEEDQDTVDGNADTETKAAEPAKAENVVGSSIVAPVDNGSSRHPADARDNPVEEEQGEKPVRSADASAKPSLASADSGETAGEEPMARKAAETAVASADVGRSKKSAAADRQQAGSDASVAKAVTGEAETGQSNQDRSAGSAENPAMPAVKAGAGTSGGSARDGAPALSPTQSAATRSGDPATAVEAPASRAAPEPATDRVSRAATPSMRSDANGATPPSVADKPAAPAPVVQVAQTAAANGDTPPTGQVAEAVARDLEELAPSRVAVSAGNAAGRPVRSLQLQLNPAELGAVNIRLHSVGGELRIAIRAESDQTAEMLSRDSDAIRSALRAAGISAPDITISVNRNDHATQQFAGQNRDASGQPASQDNRGDMSNESRNSNRDGSSGDARGPFVRDAVDPDGADRNSRLVI